MHPGAVRKTADTPRGTLFWAIITSLLIGQLVAFWMLCSHQVRKAEMRAATMQVERMAVADCLRYIPKATLNSCTNRVASQGVVPNNLAATGGKPADSKDAGVASMSSAVPVSLTVR